MVFIGLLVSPTNSQLFGNSGVTASPFVIAMSQAGIKGLPDFLNAVIMIAVASIAAESFFIASRILRSMAHQRLVPRILARVDRKGRPVPALLVTTALTILMSYINLSAGGITVFNWLAQISSTGYFMVWVFISITSFRFRAALKAQNDPLFSQPYAWKCALWPLPPLWLLACCSLYLGSSFYLALYPIVRCLLLPSPSPSPSPPPPPVFGPALADVPKGFEHHFGILLLPVHVWHDPDRRLGRRLQAGDAHEAAGSQDGRSADGTAPPEPRGDCRAG
ncbi:hypothetical protein VTK73DRAFT_2586 [Phialemonium thermophilum]|uniref:Amino acid permease/ SLC12A domain-containing protein n=1 Tax=Phialemonium thermophilum TaxID=223376 RepID=A0ABR3VRY9_9PEZI